MAMQPYISNDAAGDARRRMVQLLDDLIEVRDAVKTGEIVGGLVILDRLIKEQAERVAGVDIMMKKMGYPTP